MFNLRIVLPEIYFVSSTIDTLLSLRLPLETNARSLNHVLILYTVRTKNDMK